MFRLIDHLGALGAHFGVLRVYMSRCSEHVSLKQHDHCSGLAGPYPTAQMQPQLALQKHQFGYERRPEQQYKASVYQLQNIAINWRW